MVRGKKPATAIDEAKRFAERMGYHWMDNTDTDMHFDFLFYKTDSARVVKVRQTRNRIDPDIIYEEEYPDEVTGLRNLPFPPYIFREIWLKTRSERVFRRLHVLDWVVGDIETWRPDGYTNPHFRKDLPVKPGPTGKFIVSKIPGTRITPPPDTANKNEAKK